jgi:ABC-2 type transport system ATP-binding protein
MIQVEGLTKKYRSFTAVDDISFHIRKGEVVGFLGPNGAGKTTTMRIITTFFPATSGKATLNGHNVFENPMGVRNSIGYLPESAPLYHDMKVGEYLTYIAEAHGMKGQHISNRIREMAEKCGITDRLDQVIGTLSKGYRQRVGLAQAMIHDPEILILDEPTSGLDPNQIVEIRSLIKELGREKTVILSTHILSEAESTCDRVIIISKGKIVASGKIHELQGKSGEKDVLKLKVKGDGAGVAAKLQTYQGVSHVKQIDSLEEGTTVFSIEIAGKDDDKMRNELLVYLVNAGVSVLEFSRDSRSLEDIFAELTA